MGGCFDFDFEDDVCFVLVWFLLPFPLALRLVFDTQLLFFSCFSTLDLFSFSFCLSFVLNDTL